MVAIKASLAAAFVKAPDKRLRAILLYGPDGGLVTERGAQLARHFETSEDPPGEMLRLDDSDLEQDSGRLSVELQTVPMFGGAKVVRATAGRRVNAAAIEPLLAAGQLAGWLIIEAGVLRPDEKLRSLFEKSDLAAAIACYPDEARDLDAVIREVLAAAGLDISSEARQLLASRLGADRALSRGEIEKLALYVSGRRRIEAEDVDAIVGDAAEQTMDRIIMAAAAGTAGSALAECDRAIASGESPQSIIAAAQRHFLRLHKMRASIDAGRELETVLRGQRPPLHFKVQDALRVQLRLWSSGQLDQALVRIQEMAGAARLTPGLETLLAERLLLELARLSGVGRPRPG